MKSPFIQRVLTSSTKPVSKVVYESKFLVRALASKTAVKKTANRNSK